LTNITVESKMMQSGRTSLLLSTGANRMRSPSSSETSYDGISEVVPTVVELRAGGRLSEFSQTVEAATSGVAVAMVV